MASTSSNNEILKVYEGLPPEAQREFVAKHLETLLGKLGTDQVVDVKSSAEKLKATCDAAPKLDVKRKARELDNLFEVLDKESKLMMFGDRNNREEAIEEIVVTLTDWLNDIWSLVYEHRSQFMTAHDCLLYTAESLKHLDEVSSSRCRCDFENLTVELGIKDQTGKVVKRLRTRGAQHIEGLLFWIWRDLFLVLLAEHPESATKQILTMLRQIASLYGFPGLEKIVYGGMKIDDEDEDEDCYIEEEIYDDNDDVNGDDEDHTICPFHSSHWRGKFMAEARTLRKLVEEELFTIFSATPSLPLYDAILAVGIDLTATKSRTSAILSDVAGSTSDTLNAALGIAIINNDTQSMIHLLDEYSHLLRPRDAPVLQGVAATLCQNGNHGRAVTILENELEDTLQAIYRSVVSSFSRIEDPAHVKSLADIIKLRSGSTARRERIESWVESVLTSTGGPFGSMAFAAMMIGLPVMPGMGDLINGEDNSDLLNFIDLEGSHDPDYDDLREEFRPNLKQRLEGWTILGPTIKGGSAALARLYNKAIALMPYMKAHDVVYEMSARLADRPSKIYVSDAILSLSAFCKAQRKKSSAARKANEKKQKAAAAEAVERQAESQQLQAELAQYSSASNPFSSPGASGSGTSTTVGAAAAPIPVSSSTSVPPIDPVPGPSSQAAAPEAMEEEEDHDLTSVLARMMMAGQAAASADFAAAFDFLRPRSSASSSASGGSNVAAPGTPMPSISSQGPAAGPSAMIPTPTGHPTPSPPPPPTPPPPAPAPVPTMYAFAGMVPWGPSGPSMFEGMDDVD